MSGKGVTWVHILIGVMVGGILAVGMGFGAWYYVMKAENGFEVKEYLLCEGNSTTAVLKSEVRNGQVWSSQDESVATIAPGGKIDAHNAGETTVSLEDGPILSYDAVVKVVPHAYSDATCLEPSVCALCGEQHAAALGHNAPPATCTEASVCTRCGEQLAPANGHSFREATCQTPEICEVCGAEGAPATGHKYTQATCEKDSMCIFCGEFGPEKATGHDYADATCTAPKTCKKCGDTVGSPLGHDEVGGNCSDPVTCRRCGIRIRDALGHDYAAATCEKPETCKRCGAAKGSALGHSYSEATCKAPATCSRCGKTTGSTLSHSFDVSTYSSYRKYTCRMCGYSYKEDLVNESTLQVYCNEVISLVNKARKKAGLDKLEASGTLMKAANLRAEECADKFSHTRPNGQRFATAIEKVGGEYSYAGENIAYGQTSPEEVMEDWMNSSGHRANILNENFGKIGVGCYLDGGRLYWTQEFTD